ncbi:hypothetical protein TNIN_82131 [Trichonephila inaurata madagascariensis]|uniref:Uncharacterized protein n=1 Tax=Trichonephila inaurata madagascariensis TaxID=2747483 RepID=A0A8X6I6K6_9ARAC|nr:hypothetical protein TNIN_82131 [Trichonephila inaurata madagascariensis]
MANSSASNMIKTGENGNVKKINRKENFDSRSFERIIPIVILKRNRNIKSLTRTPAERLTCLEDGTLQNSPERKSGDSTPSQKSVNEDECHGPVFA